MRPDCCNNQDASLFRQNPLIDSSWMLTSSHGQKIRAFLKYAPMLMILKNGVAGNDECSTSTMTRSTPIASNSAARLGLRVVPMTV